MITIDEIRNDLIKINEIDKTSNKVKYSIEPNSEYQKLITERRNLENKYKVFLDAICYDMPYDGGSSIQDFLTVIIRAMEYCKDNGNY